jgi:signal peptidase II
MIEAIVMVLLVALDQIVKYLVKTNIAMGESVNFIPHVLALTHIHNTGAAFSMLSGARWFFVVLTVAFVAVALWALYAKKITHPMGRWTLVLIIAGAVGNLIDRALYGYVVDMFEVLFMNFAIFNVADIFVVVGGILFCIYFGFLHDRWKEQGK